VAQGFRAIAAADPEHWVTVDGDGSVDEVAARVLAGVRGRLPLPLGG
jgi:thymidylate kinase